MTHEYGTRHFGLGTFLAFVLGQDSHTATVIEDGRAVFYFIDDPPGRCRELNNAFFSPEGAMVNDARALLEMSRELRRTIPRAEESPDKIWQRDGC